MKYGKYPQKYINIIIQYYRLLTFSTLEPEKFGIKYEEGTIAFKKKVIIIIIRFLTLQHKGNSGDEWSDK